MTQDADTVRPLNREADTRRAERLADDPWEDHEVVQDRCRHDLLTEDCYGDLVCGRCGWHPHQNGHEHAFPHADPDVPHEHCFIHDDRPCPPAKSWWQRIKHRLPRLVPDRLLDAIDARIRRRFNEAWAARTVCGVCGCYVEPDLVDAHGDFHAQFENDGSPPS